MSDDKIHSYEHKSTSVFDRRISIISMVVNSRKPVSNIDIQCKFGYSKESLNYTLSSLVEFGYLEYTKKSNSYLYSATKKALDIFKGF